MREKLKAELLNRRRSRPRLASHKKNIIVLTADIIVGIVIAVADVCIECVYSAFLVGFNVLIE